MWTWIWLAIAALVLVVLWLRPQIVARVLLWIFIRLFYRMKVYGRENVPTEGPALLVANHVSYIDGFLILMAQRRFIRFVVYSGWTKKPLLRHLLAWSRVIPIDAASGPKAIIKSLRTASDALNEGSLVGIFAEGRFTRTGFMLPFHRGMEQIVKHTSAPIVPVCLDELWGSVFSFYGDRALWKWPRRLPYRVSVAFGKPMPATATAAEVRGAVQKLSADCAVSRSNACRTVQAEFVRSAAARPFRPCLIESAVDGGPRVFKYAEVLTRAICVARQLKPRLGEAPLVGVWLPPGIDALTANLAIAFCGRAVVNLNRRVTHETVRRVIAKAELKQVLTSAEFLKHHPLPDGANCEPIDIASLLEASAAIRRKLTKAAVAVLPGRVIERWLLRLHRQHLDDLATVVFDACSGDEGVGVMLTSRNLAAAVTSLAKTVDARPGDRLLTTIPLDQCTGHVCGLWTPLALGAAVVDASELWSLSQSSIKALGRICVDQRCTVLLTTSDVLRQMTSDGDPDEFRSLHTIVCVGSGLPTEIADEFEKRFGFRPLAAYDRSELSSIVATNVRDKTLEGFRQVGAKAGTVGQPLPGLACRVVNPETWEPLRPDQKGLLLFTGPQAMRGYWRDEPRTQAATHDGWFNTGERATIDEDGFITLTKPDRPR